MTLTGKIRFKKFFFEILALVVLTFAGEACKVSYSFTGANLSPAVKTYTVYYFPNRARLVNPTLSQKFTEDLRDRLRRQTSLNEMSDNGDIEFEGQITGYEIRPLSIQKEDLAAKNRLTITIKLKYTNHKSPEENFDKSFSAYEDYDSSQSLSEVEEELNDLIVVKLTDDIFNATIANW